MLSKSEIKNIIITSCCDYGLETMPRELFQAIELAADRIFHESVIKLIEIGLNKSLVADSEKSDEIT